MPDVATFWRGGFGGSLKAKMGKKNAIKRKVNCMGCSSSSLYVIINETIMHVIVQHSAAAPQILVGSAHSFSIASFSFAAPCGGGGGALRR